MVFFRLFDDSDFDSDFAETVPVVNDGDLAAFKPFCAPTLCAGTPFVAEKLVGVKVTNVEPAAVVAAFTVAEFKVQMLPTNSGCDCSSGGDGIKLVTGEARIIEEVAGDDNGRLVKLEIVFEVKSFSEEPVVVSE